MALRNHEFNFGLELIHKVVEEADFPILGQRKMEGRFRFC